MRAAEIGFPKMPFSIRLLIFARSFASALSRSRAIVPPWPKPMLAEQRKADTAFCTADSAPKSLSICVGFVPPPTIREAANERTSSKRSRCLSACSVVITALDEEPAAIAAAMRAAAVLLCERHAAM